MIKTNHLQWMLVFVMALAAGCATPANKLAPATMIHESLRTNPNNFSRVVFLPIWFSAAAYCDSSLTSNTLARAAGDAGQETASISARDFAGRGYQVLGPVRVICSKEDLNAFDADTRQLLAQVRAELWQLGQDIRDANSAHVPNLPFRYKLKSTLPLQAKLGRQPADALVLLDSTAFLETPAGRHKRGVWNWTGGPLLTVIIIPLEIAQGSVAEQPVTAVLPTPNSIQQTIAIVDLKTQDVLFWNSIMAEGADLRDPAQLKVVVSKLLAGLPLVSQETGNHKGVTP